MKTGASPVRQDQRRGADHHSVQDGRTGDGGDRPNPLFHARQLDQRVTYRRAVIQDQICHLEQARLTGWRDCTERE